MQTPDQTSATIRFLVGDELDIPEVFREELGIDDSTLLVIAGGAQCIVSEDKDLLDLGAYEGIRIVSAEAFLRTLEDARR